MPKAKRVSRAEGMGAVEADEDYVRQKEARAKAKGKRKGGAPPKVVGGLDKVLYVRADQALLDGVDAYAEGQRKEHPGRHVSRADAARELLLAKLEDLRLEAALS